MNMQKSTIGRYLKSLNIIYYGLIVVQLAVSAIMIIANNASQYDKSADIELKNIFLIIVIVFLFNGYYIGNYLFKKRLKLLKQKESFQSKLSEYKGIFIQRLALLEGVSVFSIIAFFITSDYTFLAITGLIILYFISFKPSPDKISMDLSLDNSDKAKLNNPDEVL